MKLSCAVFDMDGTLLTPDNKISETDLKMLRKLSDDGVRVIIATGRSELHIKEYVAMLGIADPVITCNGTVITNPSTNEVINRKFMNPSVAKSLIDTLETEGIDYLFYTPDYIYHTYASKRINFITEYNKTVPDEYAVPLALASDYPEEAGYRNVNKILIISSLSRIAEFNERFNKNGDLTIVSSGKDPSSGGDLIDVMPKNCSKGNALKTLAAHLGIPISEVAAFGDSPNDEEMLRAAGFSVAMGNAEESIKKIADFVTLRNDENGITHALRYITEEL